MKNNNIRGSYQFIVGIHPVSFRRLFGEEMRSVFDEEGIRHLRLKLVFDSLRSLAIQWLRLTRFWTSLSAVGVAALSMCWFFNRPSHRSFAENGPSLTGTMQAGITNLLALIGTLLVIVLGTAAWNLHRLGKHRWNGSRRHSLLPVALLSVLAGLAYAQSSDHTVHTQQFITVDTDVRLELLDWGGTGSPLVFLAGSGSDAHVFDEFAPKFNGRHHVYGITRRRFERSATNRDQLCF